MNKTSYKFVLVDTHRSDGLHSLKLRIIHNRKTSTLDTGFRLEPGDYDVPSQQFAANVKGAAFIELKLAEILLDAKRSVAASLENGTAINMNPTPNETDFYETVQQWLLTAEHRKSSTLSRAQRLTTLKAFAPTLTFDKITPEFLRNYDKYLVTLNNNNNTRHGKLRMIRDVYNYASREGIVKKENSPFLKYKLPATTRRMIFLEMDEVKKIEQKPMDETLEKFKKILLLLVYTGLRISDFLALKKENLVLTGGNHYIEIETIKTNVTVKIPLHPKSLSLFNEVFGTWKKVPCVQVINRYIKQVCKQAGITKSISCHSLRHSFAVVSLQLGIPLAVVANVLGHKKLSTTEIYTHVVDILKDKEFEKWNF